jgi:hypothetical protein
MRATGTDDHHASPENDCPQKGRSRRKKTTHSATGCDEPSDEDATKPVEFEAMRGWARKLGIKDLNLD